MKIAKSTALAVGVCLLSLIFSFSGEIRANAYITIGAEIPIYCLEVSDDNTHVYEIKIEPENDISPAPDSDTITVTEEGTGYFEVNINEPGTFIYKIYELAGNDPAIQYDSNIYRVMLFVENNAEDELVYTVAASIVGKDGKAEKVNFENMVMDETDIITTTTTDSVPAETTDTASLSGTSADGSEVSAEKVTTVTVVTALKPGNKGNPITGFIDSVLTGDSFPVYAVGTAMLFSILTAISTFLFKRDNSEEEDKNEK